LNEPKRQSDILSTLLGCPAQLAAHHHAFECSARGGNRRISLVSPPSEPKLNTKEIARMDRSKIDADADLIRHQRERTALGDSEDTGWIPVTVMNDAQHD
jgi:hypothetical protein